MLNNIFKKNFKFLLILIILFIYNTSLKAEIVELDNAVQDSMSQTITEVNNVDLGEAESELAKGLDEAMSEMGKGMDFALDALKENNPDLAIATMEMLESTMDIALDEIPKEEFMDFSNLKLDDFSPEELAAAQSMMGEMMTKNIGNMSDMMENMDAVEKGGFNMTGFMDSMSEGGFGVEEMFSENIEGMQNMFGENMDMMGMIEGMEMSPDMMEAFTMDSESMGMDDMMKHMDSMGNMSEMMSEHMNFENFADMANMMDDSQMDMMTEGMTEMIGGGSFDQFAGNMEMMGEMIKGDAPEGMEEKGPAMFSDNEQHENMMDMMGDQVQDMGEAFDNMSEDQMASFMEGMGQEGAMMDIGDMAGMGMDMGDMASMGMEMGMDMGEMGMQGMGDMMGGDMMEGDMMGGDMMGDMMKGDMMGGDMMGDMMGGDMMGEMMEDMGEAFGSEGEGGFINEGGLQPPGGEGGMEPCNPCGEPPPQ